MSEQATDISPINTKHSWDLNNECNDRPLCHGPSLRLTYSNFHGLVFWGFNEFLRNIATIQRAMIIVVGTKSSKSHQDVRYFAVALLKVTACSNTFKGYFNESDFNLEVK